MRIIAGKYRSRVIQTVSSHDVRPTAGRVRQTIFDLLETRVGFDSASVLDLFAGSGILGFEALSRGAEHVTFVEKSQSVLKKLGTSIELLGVGSEVTVYRQDALRFVQKKQEQPYDLIFCDPPYKYPHGKEILEAVFSNELLAAGGYFIYEHGAAQEFDGHPRLCFTKDFGTTVVSFFQ